MRKSLGTKKVLDSDKAVVEISLTWLIDKYELLVVWIIGELDTTILDEKVWESVVMWLQLVESKCQKDDVLGVKDKTKELEVLMMDCAKARFKVSKSTWLISSSNVKEELEDDLSMVATIVLWVKSYQF